MRKRLVPLNEGSSRDGVQERALPLDGKCAQDRGMVETPPSEAQGPPAPDATALAADAPPMLRDEHVGRRVVRGVVSAAAVGLMLGVFSSSLDAAGVKGLPLAYAYLAVFWAVGVTATFVAESIWVMPRRRRWTILAVVAIGLAILCGATAWFEGSTARSAHASPPKPPADKGAHAPPSPLQPAPRVPELQPRKPDPKPRGPASPLQLAPAQAPKEDDGSYIKLLPLQLVNNSNGTSSFEIQISNHSDHIAKATYSFSQFNPQKNEAIDVGVVSARLQTQVIEAARDEKVGDFWGSEFYPHEDRILRNPGAAMPSDTVDKYKSKSIWVMQAFVIAYTYANSDDVYLAQSIVAMDPVTGGYTEIPGFNFSKHKIPKEKLSPPVSAPSPPSPSDTGPKKPR